MTEDKKLLIMARFVPELGDRQKLLEKRSEGKPYRVYMMASANKFLRIYYASVKSYLDTLDEA